MSITIELTDEQQAALDKVLDWKKDAHAGEISSQFTFGGLAGTGKTTLMNHLNAVSDFHIRFLTPTGKAAHVLRTKGVSAETIHSFIYNFQGIYVDERGKEQPIFEEKEGLEYRPDLIVVDESSMVSQEVHGDLVVHGIPILWVGDHGQLPPVGGDPGLMRNLDVCLETVHRQALDNPIIQLAHYIREGGSPTQFKRDSGFNDHRVSVGSGRGASPLKMIKYAENHGIDQMICAFNATRHKVNANYRAVLGFSAPKDKVRPGERVICLKNNRRANIFNGMVFEVAEITNRNREWTEALLIDDQEAERGPFKLFKKCFGGKPAGVDVPKDCEQFDYAYCITCHKSQGSEWDKVLVIDETCRRWDMNRWRYTAYTRARENLAVITQ